MEIAKNLYIPIEADSVLSPQFYYGDPLTAIYFITSDDQYGRITFDKLDSIRVSRGEYFPYKVDEDSPYCWVRTVENSTWLEERFHYENKYYGSSYEFNGDVNEMITDFKHYVFIFHDEFIEAIAKGIWFEEDSESLLGKELSNGHPLLPISETEVVKFEAHGLTCQARINTKDQAKLKQDSVYCSQKLIQFALELEHISIDHTLSLEYRQNRHISVLKGYFGHKEIEFDHISTLEEVKPYIKSYMKEVAQRRKAMGK